MVLKWNWIKDIIAFLDKNSSAIQTIVAVIQTIVAILMLITLIFTWLGYSHSKKQLSQNEQSLKQTNQQLSQNEESLKQAKQQFEAIIEPVIDVMQYGNEVHITNSGSINISHIDIIAHCALIYQTTSMKTIWLSYNIRTSGTERISNLLKPLDDKLIINLDEYSDIFHIPVKSKTDIEAQCLVLSYRRVVDSKRYYYPIYFLCDRATKNNNENIYFPLSMKHGAATLPNYSHNSLPFNNIRSEFKKIFSEILGISLEEF